jgi:hypothetical protein
VFVLDQDLAQNYLTHASRGGSGSAGLAVVIHTVPTRLAQNVTPGSADRFSAVGVSPLRGTFATATARETLFYCATPRDPSISIEP